MTNKVFSDYHYSSAKMVLLTLNPTQPLMKHWIPAQRLQEDSVELPTLFHLEVTTYILC